MNDISNVNNDGLPSTAKLIKATVIAIAVASIILVTTILPAEYGVDPTGIGKALGLHVLNQNHGSEETLTPVQNEPVNLLASNLDSPLRKAVVIPRTDTVTVTVLPNKGVEVKSVMNEGDSFIFSWSVDEGSVYFDMHGEPPNAGKDEFTSYWVGREQQQANGNFIAPFTGTHGWYWQNTSDIPVTVTLTTTGFYGDLYMP